MIDPNGLIMDWLQANKYGGKTRTYRSWIRVREDPELIVQVRWYTAPPGAAVFPGIHAFGSAVWDQFDNATPPAGLGVTDFDFTDHCPDFQPPGITGVSCNTPLDWFLNGVPDGVVGPWPNPPCTTEGEPWIIRAWASPGGAMGTSVIPLAGLTVAEYSIRSCLNAWQVILWTNPTYTPGPNSQFTDLAEAVFTGYSRQSPVFSTTQQQADGSSVAVSAPLAWVFGGGAPVSVYGWAIVAGPTQQLITLAKLTGAPQQLVNPGDRVFIPSFWFVLSPFQPTIPVWTGAVGLGLAWTGQVRVYYLRATGCGVDSHGTDWSVANGDWVLTRSGVGQWRSPTFHVAFGGGTWFWELDPLLPANVIITQGSAQPGGDWQLNSWNAQTPAAFPPVLTQNIPGPAPFSVLVWPDQLEVDMPLIGSLVWDSGSGSVPPLHVLADGSAISRTTYAALFNYMGTTFGAGDGSTTFNVPDMRGRTPRGTSPGGLGTDRPSAVALAATGGGETHTLAVAELPPHNHGVTDPGHTHGPAAPANFFMTSATTANLANGAGTAVAFEGSTTSSTTGISTNNTGSGTPAAIMNPNMGLRPLIFAGA